ncbi:MAG: biotin--[acetyl-CoA-carboxylase] ligase, partial [Rubrobacter sp.]|nr:biotin--[acetyl-CoA-carboxylase] ligase [Rubrobacter sp.]
PMGREAIEALESPLAVGVDFHEEIDSTQRRARELARGGAPHGTLVISKVQTGGRGRRGRRWGSPPGGIWMSLVLRPEVPVRFASRITQTAAVGVAKALWDFGVEARIKWPNDLLVLKLGEPEGRKICGILAEFSALRSLRTASKSSILLSATLSSTRRAPRSSTRSTSCPSSDRIVATPRSATFRSSGSKLALRPTPRTTKSRRLLADTKPARFAATDKFSALNSARMPQILRPSGSPGLRTSRSFGHFIRASTPKPQRAFATPTAAVWVTRAANRAGTSGRSTSDIQMPPEGDPHRRPRRPRPPVCTFEITSVPCGAPP